MIEGMEIIAQEKDQYLKGWGDNSMAKGYK